jgi:hypothetical protein
MDNSQPTADVSQASFEAVDLIREVFHYQSRFEGSSTIDYRWTYISAKKP